MSVKFANSAFATLAAGINSSATSITLTTGQGARFPSLGAGDYFYATLIDASNNLEIVKCTARSTDVLTVVRGQESTTARAYSAGDRIELRITAAGLVDLISGLDGDHGDITVSGSGLVWTIDSGAITDAKIDTMSATKLTGTIDKARLPAGTVLQVQSTTLTTPQSYGGGVNAISGLSVSITPRSTSSKVLLLVNLSALNSDASGSGWLIYRNGSALSGAIGSSVSSRRATTAGGMYAGGSDTSSERMQGGHLLDSPSSTSAQTYQVYFTINGSNAYLNRSGTDNDSSDRTRSISSITAIEIGG